LWTKRGKAAQREQIRCIVEMEDFSQAKTVRPEKEEEHAK